MIIPAIVTAVHQDYRSKGIGKQLLDWLIDYALKQNIEKMRLMVSKDNFALNLYRECDFEDYEDTEDSLLMIKKL